MALTLGTAKLLATIAAMLVALLGLWAAKEIGKIKKPLLFSVSQAFTAGVLFAAGLCHMLPDSTGDLVEAYLDDSPRFGSLIACTSAAIAFLLLLSIEEIVSALLPANSAVPHSDAACVTYRAQFPILPRKELVGPHGCCEDTDPDSCCEAIAHRNTQEREGLADPLLPRYHNECCPVHEHDHVHRHTHDQSISEADIDHFLADVDAVHHAEPPAADGKPKAAGNHDEDIRHILEHHLTHHHHKELEHTPVKAGACAEIGAITLFIALSFHSVMEGLGIGSATHSWEILPVLTAILAHKALAAFALGCSFVESGVSDKRFVTLGLIFAAGTPIGALFGDIGYSAEGNKHTAAVFSAVCKALAAGTFLQVSSMEIIPQVFASAEGRFSKLSAVLVGFGAMAVLALWI